MAVELVAFDIGVEPQALERFLGRKYLPAGTPVATRYYDAGRCSSVLRQWYREMSAIFMPRGDAGERSTASTTGEHLFSLYGYYAFACEVAGVTVSDDVQQLAEHHASRVADQLQLGLISISESEPRVWLPALR